MKTVGADKKLCLDSLAGHQRDMHEIRGLFERHHVRARRDDPGTKCVEQEGMEPRAMQCHKRSTYFLVDAREVDLGAQRPPARIENGGASHDHAGAGHGLAKSKRLKGLDSVRRQTNASADRTQVIRSFEHAHARAATPQRNRKREPTNTGTSNDDVRDHASLS
jgi:hypothetical protein